MIIMKFSLELIFMICFFLSRYDGKKYLDVFIGTKHTPSASDVYFVKTIDCRSSEGID